MASWCAASSALRESREAMAAISLQSPFCIAGITFFTAIAATPSTPHLTFCPLTLSPPVLVFGVRLLACACSVRACSTISLLEFFLCADGFQVSDAVDAEDSVEMIDFVLKQFGKVAELSGLNFVCFPFQVLVLHSDFAVALDLHKDGQKAKTGIPHHDSLGAALDDSRIHEGPRAFAR